MIQALGGRLPGAFLLVAHHHITAGTTLAFRFLGCIRANPLPSHFCFHFWSLRFSARSMRS